MRNEAERMGTMELLPMLQMFQICDSLFPIGSFTLSNGLETFVSDGSITTEEQLAEYVNTFLGILPYNDLGVMMLAYKYAEQQHFIRELDNYYFALKNPRQVREGSKKMCSRFLKIWDKIANYVYLQQYANAIKKQQCQGIHGIAVGLYAKEIGFSMEGAGSVYAYSLLSAIITNGVKLIPLSQIAGQKILNGAIEKIGQAVQQADQISMEELGVGGSQFDIAAMNHETLYSRLYMS